MIITGALSMGDDMVVVDDRLVSLPPHGCVVRDVDGSVLGRVVRAWVEDGMVIAEMEVDDGGVQDDRRAFSARG